MGDGSRTELRLRPGEWIEVKSEEEILATLDADGTVQGLLFMPEMLRFCGTRFPVFRRADKTCDTVTKTGGRRMRGIVHLEARCDGGGHGGCQASCLLFWKESWLKRADGPSRKPRSASPESAELRRRLAATALRTAPGSTSEVLYRCQATNLVKASSPLAWWDLRQYWRDWRYGNASLGRILRVLTIATFNALQRKRDGGQYPRFPPATLEGRTPAGRLDLQPGELVQIKSPAEIATTLDVNGKNRGMRYDAAEQTPYCGGIYKVLKRVERLIDEPTGRMIEMANPCLILDGVLCSGDYSRKRLMCPRAIYSYWREIWLSRVESTGVAQGTGGSSQ